MRSLSSLPAITKYHRLSGVNNRHFLSHSFWRLQVQEQDVSSVIPSEASLLSLQIATFLLSPALQPDSLLFEPPVKQSVLKMLPK